MKPQEVERLLELAKIGAVDECNTITALCVDWLKYRKALEKIGGGVAKAEAISSGNTKWETYPQNFLAIIVNQDTAIAREALREETE